MSDGRLILSQLLETQPDGHSFSFYFEDVPPQVPELFQPYIRVYFDKVAMEDVVAIVVNDQEALCRIGDRCESIAQQFPARSARLILATFLTQLGFTGVINRYESEPETSYGEAQAKGILYLRQQLGE